MHKPILNIQQESRKTRKDRTSDKIFASKKEKQFRLAAEEWIKFKGYQDLDNAFLIALLTEIFYDEFDLSLTEVIVSGLCPDLDRNLIPSIIDAFSKIWDEIGGNIVSRRYKIQSNLSAYSDKFNQAVSA